MNRARLLGGLGYLVIFVVCLAAAVSSYPSSMVIYDSLAGLIEYVPVASIYGGGTPVTLYYYYVLAILSLLMVSLGWLLLPVRRVIFIITGAFGVLSVVIYAAVYLLFFDSSLPNNDGIIPAHALLLGTVVQAIAMFVAARTFRQPLFYGAALLLLAYASFTFYTPPGSPALIETFRTLTVEDSVFLAVTGLFAAFCFLGAPWKHQDGGTAAREPGQAQATR